MGTLPHKQAAMLEFLRRQEERGEIPTIREMCEHFGFASPRAAQELIEKLEQKGAIRRTQGVSRSIRVVWSDAKKGWVTRRAPHRLPLLGRIAAGAPITAGIDAVEQASEFIDIDPALFDTPPDMLWQVDRDGYSMVNIGVLPGDIVGVTLRSDFKNRQIVAAVVNDPRTDDPMLTLKRYEKRGSLITLFSENDDQITYKPMVFDVRKDTIHIVGIYSGLVRRKVQ